MRGKRKKKRKKVRQERARVREREGKGEATNGNEGSGVVVLHLAFEQPFKVKVLFVTNMALLPFEVRHAEFVGPKANDHCPPAFHILERILLVDIGSQSHCGREEQFLVNALEHPHCAAGIGKGVVFIAPGKSERKSSEGIRKRAGG